MLKNLSNITPKQIKVFCMTFIAMFIIVALQHSGIRINIFENFKIPQIRLISPLPEKTDAFYELLPKLEQKKINFELKKETHIIPQSYASNELLADNANAYIVVDLDSGQILAEKNSDQRYAIASLTKIMSSVTALDLASPDEEFTIIDRDAHVVPTIIGVTPGEKLTLEELLNGSLLTSGNDAAEAIRNGIDAKYGAEVFIRAMNEKANIIGLENTHFTNPQGFDYGDNYSTAYDLALLSQYALTQYPLIDSIVKKDYQYFPPNHNHKEFKMINWNGLIGVYPDTQGIKIGFTGAAGRTTAVVSNREGKKILVVLLGAPGIMERDLWAAQLLDYGYQKTLSLSPINVNEYQLQAKYDSWYY
jgi:D-alanyl-D-alanine carboxypeptidase